MFDCIVVEDDGDVIAVVDEIDDWLFDGIVVVEEDMYVMLEVVAMHMPFEL